MPKNFLTIQQAAKKLQIGERSVYRYIEDKELKAIKIGFWRIDKKSVEGFIKRRSSEFLGQKKTK